MKIVSWNLNYDPRAKNNDDSFNYEAFDWKYRSRYVLDDISLFLEKNKTTVIFAFQEVMPQYMEDLNGLLSETHHIFTKKVHDIGRHLYTAIPKQFHTAKQELEELEGCRNCWDIFGVNDQFWLMNVHLPMAGKFRLPISKHVAANGYHSIPSIIVGDFNTFSDELGYEQMRQIQAEGYYDASSILLGGSMKEPFVPDLPRRRILQTFEPYPYDVISDNLRRYPINFDHIFVHGSLQHDTPICYDQAKFHHKGQIIADTGDFGHSDHFAISINIM